MEEITTGIPSCSEDDRDINQIPVKYNLTAEQESQTDPNITGYKPTAPKKKTRLQFYKRVLPNQCIAFSSERGKQLFKEALMAGYGNIYFQLAEQFCTQAEPAYCGLTTLVMVLNALAVDPKRIWRGGWRWYHEEMLDCCLSLDAVQQKGITMEQFISVSVCNSLDLNVVRMNDNSFCIDDFRKTVKKICSGTGNILVSSYSRKAFGQTGDGHFSPIGAYHEADDLVLIFDVARFKYPPHWVKLQLMWEAMKYCDATTGKPRGYVIMRKTEEMPLVLFRLSSTFRVTIATHSLAKSHMAIFLKSWKVFLKGADECGFGCKNGFENTLKCLLEDLNEALSSLMESESVLTTQFDLCCTDSLEEKHIEQVNELLNALESTDMYKITLEWVTEFKKANTSKAQCSKAKFCGKINCCRIDRVGKAENDIEEMGNVLNDSMKCITENWQQGKNPCVHNNCTEKKTEKTQIFESHYITMFLLSWPYIMEGESTHITSLSKYVDTTLKNSVDVLQNEANLLRKQIESLAWMVGQHDDQ